MGASLFLVFKKRTNKRSLFDTVYIRHTPGTVGSDGMMTLTLPT